jgi:hypothetical protein
MLIEPIVEGAYYLCENGDVHRAGGYARGWDYLHDGQATWWGTVQAHIKLVRRVYIVPTDPAEVVAELREREQEANRLAAAAREHTDYYQGQEEAYESAADLVAEKLIGDKS